MELIERQLNRNLEPGPIAYIDDLIKRFESLTVPDRTTDFLIMSLFGEERMSHNGVHEEQEDGTYAPIETKYWYDMEDNPLGYPHYSFTRDYDVHHVFNLIEKYTPGLVIISTKTVQKDAEGVTLWQINEAWFEHNGYEVVVYQSPLNPKRQAIAFLQVWLIALRAKYSGYPDVW